MMQEMKRHAYALKPSEFMGESSKHKLSSSFPDKRDQEHKFDISSKAENSTNLDMEKVSGVSKSKRSLNSNHEISLKEEIRHLEKRLQDQFVVRSDLEQAVGSRSFSHITRDIENSKPKPSTELIKEIAVLELEVAHLEQYLLSLYRKAFGQRISSICQSSTDESSKSPPITEKKILFEDNGLHGETREHSVFHFTDKLVPQDSDVTPQKEPRTTMTAEMLLDSGIHRCHSSLSQHSTFSNRIPIESVARAIQSFHSQPLSFMESDIQHMVGLAENLDTCIPDYEPETPNKISEDMIKSISSIYCKLCDPPLKNHDLSYSPTSFTSPVSEISPRDQYNIWSPRHKKDSSFDAQSDNPFQMDGLKDFSETYSTMVEVPSISRDNQMLSSIDHMLQNFRSLVCKLEKLDVKKMKHEEKLAFWINIHNALVMHAFLAYGIPQNSIKRVSLFLKVAYNVGGQMINVDTIQSSILRCRTPRPGQWFRTLFSTRTKLKSSDNRQGYAIEHPEPLLYFALCTGSYSDPVVRIYTSKRVIQELDTAKEEYIRATLAFDEHKEHKIRLPKIVESFAKDSCLSPIGVVEMIKQLMPEVNLKTISGSNEGKSRKSIEWVPHIFAFRYLISKELIK